MKKHYIDYFLTKDWSFVLIKDGKVVYSELNARYIGRSARYKSKSQGLKPLVFCLRKYKKEMKNAVVYDKIVGLAAAMLLAYGKVKEVWTPIISKDARKYLEKHRIKIIYKKEVKNILNKDGTDICPMEKIAEKAGLRELSKILKLR
jgi:hypothetical protein